MNHFRVLQRLTLWLWQLQQELDQYIVVDDDGVSAYRNWFRDYTLQTIGQVLEKVGFHVVNKWNDLTGIPHKEGGDWIAIVGAKK